MKTFKPFQTLIKGHTSLSSAFTMLKHSPSEFKADTKGSTMVAVVTEKELQSNPPEWYKSVAENDSFVSDLRTSKSAWIYHGNNRILLATHDESKAKTPEKCAKAARSIGVKVMEALHGKKVRNATMHLSDCFSHESFNQFVNASVLMNYKYSKKEDIFEKDMSEQDKKDSTVHPQLLQNIQFCTPQSLSNKQIKDTEFYITAAKSTLYGRDVINTRGSEGNPDFLEDQIRGIAEGHNNISNIEVIKGDELATQGLNLFYNVGKAATSPPRLVNVYYKGRPECTITDYAIVGKGLTYDTGGLNLKPTGFMETMY